MRTFKKKKVLLLFLLPVLFLFFVADVKADNRDVKDGAGIIDEEAQQRVEQVNDNELSKIKGHPQIAFVTANRLPRHCSNPEEYAQWLFNRYEFGNKGYDNGVLFLIVLHPRDVRMQTGYGAESVVPDAFLPDKIMPGGVRNDFRKGDYSAGVIRITDITSRQMLARKADFRSYSAVNAHKADMHEAAKTHLLLWCSLAGLAVLLLIFYLIYWLPRVKKEHREIDRKFDKYLSKCKLDISEKALDYEDRLSYADKRDILRKARAMGFAGAYNAIVAGIIRSDLWRSSHDDDDDDDDNNNGNNWTDLLGGGGFFGGGSGFGSGSGGFFGGSSSFGGGGGFSGGGGSDAGW